MPANSQVNNTPGVIYSLGNNRKSNWKRILGIDTVTMINPRDKYPLCKKNINDKSQYRHGGVEGT